VASGNRTHACVYPRPMHDAMMRPGDVMVTLHEVVAGSQRSASHESWVRANEGRERSVAGLVG
jgi:hypothetical protein